MGVMNLQVYQASLDLWPAAKAFFKEFKESQYEDRISVDLPDFEGLYLVGVEMPGILSGVGVLLLFVDGTIVGLSILQEIQELCGLVYRPRTLVRGVHIRPNVGLQAGLLMDKAIDKWARVRGHDLVVAYTRMPHGHVEAQKNGFKLKAMFKRFGYKPRYLVMIKNLVQEGVSHGER